MNATRRERAKRPPISRSWQLPHPPPRTYADLHTFTYILWYTHTHTCRRTQAPSLDIRLQDPIPSIHPILLQRQSPTSRGEHQSPNQPTHTQPTRESPTNVSPTQFSHLPHLPHISHPNVTPAAKHPMLSQISSSSSSSSSIAASLAPIPPPIIPADLTTLSHTHMRAVPQPSRLDYSYTQRTHACMNTHIHTCMHASCCCCYIRDRPSLPYCPLLTPPFHPIPSHCTVPTGRYSKQKTRGRASM